MSSFSSSGSHAGVGGGSTDRQRTSINGQRTFPSLGVHFDLRVGECSAEVHLAPGNEQRWRDEGSNPIHWSRAGLIGNNSIATTDALVDLDDSCDYVDWCYPRARRYDPVFAAAASMSSYAAASDIYPPTLCPLPYRHRPASPYLLFSSAAMDPSPNPLINGFAYSPRANNGFLIGDEHYQSQPPIPAQRRLQMRRRRLSLEEALNNTLILPNDTGRNGKDEGTSRKEQSVAESGSKDSGAGFNCASNVYCTDNGIYLNDTEDQNEKEDHDDADSADWHSGVVKVSAATPNHFQKVPLNGNGQHSSKLMRRRTAAGAALFRHGELPGKFPVNPAEDDNALDYHHQHQPYWRQNGQSGSKEPLKARSRSQPQHDKNNQSNHDELPKPPRSKPYAYPTYIEQRAAIVATRVNAAVCKNGDGDEEEGAVKDGSSHPSTSQGQCSCQRQQQSSIIVIPVNRTDRYSIDSSEAGCGSCSQDSGIRSSTHSNSSQSTATSGGTIHHNGGVSNSNGNKHQPQKKRETRCSSSMLLVEAVWDHVAMLTDELPFTTGDIITVVDTQSTNSGLWYGVCRDRSGWFPSAYVRVKDPHDHYLLNQMEQESGNRVGHADNAHNNSLSSAECGSDDTASLRGSDDGRLNETHRDPLHESFPPPMRYLRRKIVQELMATERDYVQLLDNLADGFAEQCRRRHELFNEERIRRVFGNLDDLRQLHVKFLRDLEASYNKECAEMSCMGRPFLRHGHCFGVYTEYCNNRPVSCAELASLFSQPQYHHFFEACRLLRGMPKLSLEGFLLTPVQRICRYPLQLMELLKATPASHPDRRQLEQAHRTMRAVAAHINDSKRRLDGIQKIILWQRNVHAFRGPDLVDNNHRMLNSGEMNCRALVRGGGLGQNSGTSASLQWAKTVHVYLFDQSIVLCKKDVLKKGALVFKERMSLQGTSVTDLNDGKELTTGCQLKNSFKLSGPTREYIFTCPDPATKGLWLDAMRSRPRPTPPSSAEKRLAIITLNCVN